MFSARDLESTNPANRSLKPFTASDFKGAARICHSICHGLQAVNSPVTNSFFVANKHHRHESIAQHLFCPNSKYDPTGGTPL